MSEDENTAKRVRGLPEHEPTDESRARVIELAKVGVTQDSIAVILGIAPKTLRKYYASELKLGRALATEKVANKLFSMGVEQGNVTALIFWLKSRDGWSDRGPSDGDDDAEPEPVKIIRRTIDATKPKDEAHDADV
jgi:hypothetical protein